MRIGQELLGVFEYLKISISDLIETLGLVLTRPWKMAKAVFEGGNVLENALLYYFFLISASALIAFYPFNLGAEFTSYAQAILITSFLVLAITSVFFYWGLKLCRVPITFTKVLTIKAFLSGAYVLITAILLALATSLIAILVPEEKQTFSALALACVPIYDFSSGVPVIVAPSFGFAIHLGISIISFFFGAFLFFGAYFGLRNDRGTSMLVFSLVAIAVFVIDFLLSAAFAGMNFNDTSAFCIAAKEAYSN